MGFGLIIAGIFFIFNPYVNVIDVLPDIIGYLLIFAGTHKLALMNGDIMTSRRYFNAMIWISAGRIAATIFLIFFNDGFLALTLTIIASVADSIYAIRGFSLLLSALDAMSCMSGDTKISANSVRQFTPVAIISKNLLSLIPEFTELSVEDEFGNVGLVAYKSMFSLICVIIGLVIGVAWLVMTVGYIRALSQNKLFFASLETRYNNEIATDAALFTRLDLTSFIKVFPLPLLFLLQINFDGYYIVPEFLCPVMIIVLLLRVRKYSNVRRPVFAAAASGAVLLVKYIMMFLYSSRFGSYAYPYEAEGFWHAYLSYIIPAAVGYAFLAFTAAQTVTVISDIARRHTGEIPHGDIRLDELNVRVAGELIKRCKFVFAWIIALCIILIASSASAAFFNMGYMIAIVLDAFIIVLMYSFCAELSEQITRRYT